MVTKRHPKAFELIGWSKRYRDKLSRAYELHGVPVPAWADLCDASE